MTWLNDSYNAFMERMLRPTDKNSRREVAQSPYFAEFWCTISNIGFFLVGIYFCEPLILFAGLASALSHAIPRQGLHDLDMLAVLIMGSKIILNLGILVSNPTLLVIAAGTVLINIIDTAFSRNNYQKIGPWLHVVWHLTAAASMFIFYQAIGLSSIFTMGLPMMVPFVAFGSLLFVSLYLAKLEYLGRIEDAFVIELDVEAATLEAHPEEQVSYTPQPTPQANNNSQLSVLPTIASLLSQCGIYACRPSDAGNEDNSSTSWLGCQL